MGGHSEFVILENCPDYILIQDVGSAINKSVTNDAENVVQQLVAAGHLTTGKHLLYFDSEGRQDEILHDGKEFKGFRLLSLGL